MKDYEFTLKFALPDANTDPVIYVEQLGEAGCDDALVGLGQTGRIALQFSREAESAYAAIVSAIKDVKRVIPDAELVEATPDLVGLSDIAEIIHMSRQNMRKLMLSHRYTFPVPLHEGKSSIWHLSNVLQWFESQQNRVIEPSIKEVAFANMQVNLVKETQKLDPQYQAELALLAI